VNGFLADPALTPLWASVRAALDRNGLAWRGRLSVPALTPEGRRRLGVLIERPVPPQRRTVPLAELAAAVERLAGAELVEVLGQLGHRPSGRHEENRARQQARLARRDALDAAVTRAFDGAAWARGWAEAAWTDGLFADRAPEQVPALVRTVADVLALGGTGRSRTDVAARLLGDAHALDSATRLAALVTRALVARDGAESERVVWERAGMPLDLVSAPVLTWGLPLVGPGAVATAVSAMTAAGLPLHLSALALRAEPLRVAPATPVLVVENPRLVEAAAQRRLPAAVLCTNGNPTTAPSEAIGALGAAGALLRYHGDFDTPGLAIAARAHAAGCAPFAMTGDDYRAALAAAAADGVELPADPGPVPATPWDLGLGAAFAEHRRVVHQERVMDDVLAAHAGVDSHRRARPIPPWAERN
jgi:uncharacterized protein (TIGR02679 family)